MKKTFGAYAPLPEADLARIWKSGLIVLDASVLLNLYCYSPSTRDNLLDGLASVPDRLWLPHQAAAEFCLGRPRVIEQQRTKCDEALKAFDQALKALYSDTSHPFVSRDLRTRLEQAQVVLQREVKAARQGLDKMLTKDDPILARALTLFEGRVGDCPTQEDRESLYAEAATRYKHRIPPGFADQDKPDDRQYGDFVLWKQMVRQATDRTLPVLFVTDDTKDDWWWKGPGRSASALPALRVELEQASGQPFQMYETSVFIREAKARLKWKVKDDTLKEISESATEARRMNAVLEAAFGLVRPDVRAELARLGLLNVTSTGVGTLPHLVGHPGSEVYRTAEAATRYAALTGLGSPTALILGTLNPSPPKPGTTPPAAPTTGNPSAG